MRPAKKIGFAVIGCGNIGMRHLEALSVEPGAVLVAACDIDKKKLLAVQDLYGIEAFSDYKKLLKEPRVQVVNICTPSHLHAEMAIAAAKAGKHVLAEKPMALTVADCRKMIAAAKKNGTILSVVKQNRHNIPVQLLKKAIEDGVLGKIYAVKCDVLWNRSDEYYSLSDWRGKKHLEGGSLHTQVSHFVDLLLWLFGDIKTANTYAALRGHTKIDIEDCGTTSLNFANGIIGNLFWTTCVYNKNYEGSILVIAENGTVKIGGQYLNKIEFWDVKSYPLPSGIATEETSVYERANAGARSNHWKVFRDLIAKLNKQKNNAVTAEEGMATVATIEKIYASATDSLVVHSIKK